jgi:hypothetical protein
MTLEQFLILHAPKEHSEAYRLGREIFAEIAPLAFIGCHSRLSLQARSQISCRDVGGSIA